MCICVSMYCDVMGTDSFEALAVSCLDMPGMDLQPVRESKEWSFSLREPIRVLDGRFKGASYAG